MALLEVTDLQVFYGVIQALKGISFEVNQGEIVTLIGANGAGKTTTMHTVIGLIQPRNGTIVYNGKDITKMPSHKIVASGISQVPEGRRIFQELSVYDNLMLGAYLQKDQKKIKDDIENVFDQFPILGERRTQIAGTLSGGEQQMLAMSRALMAHPTLLMMDEPSMGLSPLLVSQVFDIIKDMNDKGITILLVEQNAEKALKIADRGYVLETGAITASGTGAELASSPEIRKAYLGG